MNIKIKISLAAVALVSLAGCGGGDTYVRVQGTTTISKGQELSDLQRALKEGAVTKQEYDQLYSKILARPN